VWQNKIIRFQPSSVVVDRDAKKRRKKKKKSPRHQRPANKSNADWTSGS